MATSIPKNSVWSAMSYPPPKGRCNYKTSLMSPACPCLRFMLHPVKAATSFECDGCNHHASFHSLENPTEDAMIARWEAQEAEREMERQAVQGANKKRKRIAEKPAVEEVMELEEPVPKGREMLALPGGFEIVDVDESAEVETVGSEVEDEMEVVVQKAVRGASGRPVKRGGMSAGLNSTARKPRLATTTARAKKT